MEDLIRKLTELFHAELPGSDVELEEAVPGFKVGGLVMWAGFDGLDAVDRQDHVWDLLDDRLTRDERASVSVLLTLTPEETVAARAG